MSRFSPLDGHNSLEPLEQKLSSSSVGVVAAPVVSTIQATLSHEDYPLPNPEPANIPYPGVTAAIVYPVIPPSGPPGPGF